MIAGTTKSKPKPANSKKPEHFSISQKMGFSSYLHCWCGCSIEMRYRGKPIESIMSVFREAHEDCKPVEASVTQ